MSLSFEAEFIRPSMFVGALVLVSFGYPVAFSLGEVPIIFGVISIVLRVFDPNISDCNAPKNFGNYGQLHFVGYTLLYFYGGNVGKIWHCRTTAGNDGDIVWSS